MYSIYRLSVSRLIKKDKYHFGGTFYKIVATIVDLLQYAWSLFF